MTPIHLEIRIKPRPGLLNPEGKAIHHALTSLEWDQVTDVRVGKTIYMEVEADSEEAAVEAAEAMCRKILANPVTEDFQVAVVEEATAS